MDKQASQGFSLIEVVIFIIVMAVLTAGVMRAFMVTSLYSFDLQYNAQALNLAQARMELLLGQKASIGFRRFSDPCVKGRAPAVCLTAPGYNVTSSIRYDRKRGRAFKVITVVVKKPDNKRPGLTLTSLVANN